MAGKGKGLMKPVELSDELAEFMGKSHASRPQVMKKIWAYIKTHGLQDEDNKRNLTPAGELVPILGSRTITMFQIAKKLAPHFLKG